MTSAFIIMQIGNPELDNVCARAIVPAVEVCGLDAKRIDKHNTGGLLKGEIITFIQSADIIIADLTNERTNCYLEVGYAMGIDKFSSLILTAREDHNQDSLSYQHGGPKVHFDLSGYDILFWSPENLEAFRNELEKRIRRRLTITSSTAGPSIPVWDNAWVEKHKGNAFWGLQTAFKTSNPGSMEVGFALSGDKPNFLQRVLLDAANEAQIPTFGWPIGVVLNNRKEYRPRSTADGIVAEIGPEESSGLERRLTYDYWTLRKNGDFYLLQSFFEDMRKSGLIYFNTRIVRVTETFLYCARLYNRLGIPNTSIVNISIVHRGLKNRMLTSVGGRDLFQGYTTAENEVGATVSPKLLTIETNLVNLVKEVLSPVFMVFDYFEPSDSIYADIVNNFVA
jgi:hypothetical protein